MSEQPDGSYPRINGKVLKSGEYVNKIVSLVGKVEVFDGTSIQLTCSDGVIASVQCETDAEVMQGSTYELIGLSNDNGTLQVSILIVNVKSGCFSLISKPAFSCLFHENLPKTWTWIYTTA